ncbi:MAG: DUF4167 domain-containing protein [Hyphomicrobiales bacterium]|jgi:hypothetical protein|nr:DUF4167 domain-containing protein [Hyphomicrobiales bacterium]|tara:strand:+ start:85 stop:519 length:435 start_codon:yes stop_codon:yes gene_type:complete
MVKPRNNNNRRRNNRRPGGNNGNNSESNGPSIKVRGSSKQIYEKYISLARDAQSSGDNVLQESYFQHAEHYARILIESGKFEKQESLSEDKNSSEQSSNGQVTNSTGHTNNKSVEEKVLNSKEEIKENVISIPDDNDLDVAESS